MVRNQNSLDLTLESITKFWKLHYFMVMLDFAMSIFFSLILDLIANTQATKAKISGPQQTKRFLQSKENN